MKREKTCRSVFSLILWLLAMGMMAQKPIKRHGETPAADSLDLPTVEAKIIRKEKTPFVSGIAVGGDLAGFAMKAVGAKFANMEVSGRLNFKEKYFPLVELGIGDCTREGSENNNKFKTTSPYYRVGMDYNFNKKPNGNRLFGGARYAFSSFNFDFDAPDISDPVWQTPAPLRLHDLNSKCQWLEFVVGVETKLWSIVRLGWNIRYKVKLHQSNPQAGSPWYVPGFGKNGSTTWGGTVNLMFDTGKSARKYKPAPVLGDHI